VHSDGRTKEITLADWAMEYCASIKGVGEHIETTSGERLNRDGVVHRIDRDTSGVLLMAKTEECFLGLKKQFQERSLSKIYNAFVWGTFKEKQIIVNKPIGRSKSNFVRFAVLGKLSGRVREAETRIKVLENTNLFSFLEISPLTGRTHQIRVHLQYLGHAILCDKLYAPKKPCELGFSRLALHARSISFSHPVSGARLHIEAELPLDFINALNLMGADKKI
jgi:23S rRNA pseudouridine1911/1915/1917 synthase